MCVLCVCEREIEREKYSGTRGRLKLWFAPACPWLVHMLFVSCMYVTFFLLFCVCWSFSKDFRVLVFGRRRRRDLC